MQSVGPKETAARIDGTSRLTDAYEPSPLELGPDRMPILPRIVALPTLDERAVCDRGPCRHRHVYTGNVEAMRPRDGSPLTRPKLGPDGQPIVLRREADGTEVYVTEPWEPREVTRACYPAAGVVIELSADQPVLECSRWDPEDPDDYQVRAREERRRAYQERTARARATAAGEIGND